MKISQMEQLKGKTQADKVLFGKLRQNIKRAVPQAAGNTARTRCNKDFEKKIFANRRVRNFERA